MPLSTKKILVALGSVILLQFSLLCQTFKKAEDNLHNPVIKYSNQLMQLELWKTITDSSNIYELGIYVYRTSIDLNYFMSEGAIIELSNGDKILFSESIRINYLYSGRHQASIKHRLNSTELKKLQENKIVSFKILDSSKSLDKWQQQELIDVFNKIPDEK